MLRRLHELVRSALASPLLQVLAILALFKLTWLWFFVLGVLPESSYQQASILLGMSESPLLSLFVVVNVVVLGVWRQRITWHAIDPSGCARWFVMVPVALMTLQFAAADINFYYDQTHLFDRLLLFLLAAGVLVHPMVVTVWFALLMAMAGQLHHPLQESEWMWADKRLLFDFVALFHCFLYVRLVAPMKPRMLLVMTLTLTGASYFFAGYSKMMLGPHWYSWMTDDQLSNIVVAAYKNGGWWRPLGDEGIVSFADTVSQIERPLAVATLLIELGGVLLFLHRRITYVLLVGFVLLHLGILATTGIFFWKWSLFDLALLVYLRRFLRANPEGEVAPVSALLGAALASLRQRLGKGASAGAPRIRWAIFGPTLSLAMTLLMLMPRAYSMPTGFGWYDSPVTNYFELRGIAASGKEYTLSPRFFAPYDLLMQQSRFYFLVNHPVLAGTYGTVHDHRLAAVLRETELTELEAVRQKWGKNQFDPERATAFAGFLRTFVRNAQERQTHDIAVLGWLAPPYHFQTFAADDVYEFQETLVAIEIRYREYFFDGAAIHTVLDRPVGRVDLR